MLFVMVPCTHINPTVNALCSALALFEPLHKLSIVCGAISFSFVAFAMELSDIKLSFVPFSMLEADSARARRGGSLCTSSKVQDLKVFTHAIGPGALVRGEVSGGKNELAMLLTIFPRAGKLVSILVSHYSLT